MQTVAITSNFQVHIPAVIRKQIKLDKPTQAKIVAKGDQIIIKPLKTSFLDLAGSLHKEYKKKPINVDRVRDYIDYSS